MDRRDGCDAGEPAGEANAAPVDLVDLETLTALALAADPDVVVADDAEPLRLDDGGAELLPEWYMPARLRPDPLARSSRRRAWAVGAIVAALVAVNGAGLCVTYGLPEIAW